MSTNQWKKFALEKLVIPQNFTINKKKEINSIVNKIYKSTNQNNNEVFKTLPPLIKGYLRLGVHVGEGAVIDKQFNTIDVCIVLKTSAILRAIN